MNFLSRLARCRRVIMGAALLWALALFGGCSGIAQEDTSSTGQAVAGTITISGTIFDAMGRPLSGVSVQLNGRSQARVTTAAAGTYAFQGLIAGSYSVNPALSGCNFDPTVVNLNNLTQNAVANFDGSGSSCGGDAQNGGGHSGSLTISGVVTRAGNPVAGVRITLSGSAQAFRTTGASGAYSIQVNPGSYSLHPSGPCAFTPDNVNLNNLAASVVQNFAAGTGCAGVPQDGGVIDSGRDAGRPDVCVPTTCAAAGRVCGPLVDGCGGTLQCGTCGTNQTCSAAGQCVNVCVPTTCAAAGRVCGPLADGCGATLQCGNCPTGQSCNAAGQCVTNCVPTTCAAAGRVCGPLADGCGGTLQCGTCPVGSTCNAAGACINTNPCGNDSNTTACLTSRGAGCLQCATDNGCLDPAQIGGVCEGVTGAAPAACSAVLGTTGAPTEKQVCMRTLNDIFTSGCAADGQETPCLCGATDPVACQNGSAPPQGAVFPVYQCDLGPAIASVVGNFVAPTLGAGMANTIVQCVAAFGCSCF